LPDSRTEADTEDEADSKAIEQAKQVAALHAKGLSYRAIGTELGISPATVMRRKKLAFQQGAVSP
jgi:DNA-binding NarL/FixJ family response regulator